MEQLFWILMHVWLFIPVNSLDNGFTKPPMGFNPWNCFGTGANGHQVLPGSHPYNDSVIRQVADAIVSTGLRDAGYKYINLDCGWSTGFRSKNGSFQVNMTRYPYGIKNLADYIHSKKLKFGIYSDAGKQQCCSRIHPNADDGSLGYENADAHTFASWGVDYLKHDGCGSQWSSYPTMRDALNKTGRPIYYSVHTKTDATTIKNVSSIANIWRTKGDITHSWASFISEIENNDQYAHLAKPGQFNDPDMMEVGNPPLTPGENRVHFSLWCITKAPLLIGTDVTNMTQSTLTILSNRELIAINQDELGIQGRLVHKDKTSQVWAGLIKGRSYGIVLVNTDTSNHPITLDWDMIDEKPSTIFLIRDLWQHKDLGQRHANITVDVLAHDVVALKLTHV